MKSKNLKFLIAGSLLLTLVSCGKDHKSSSRREVNTLCEGVNCLSSVNWKIQLPGRSFPERGSAVVEINGTTVLNECVAKQKYVIDRSADPEMLYLENYSVPKRGEVAIKVGDCRRGTYEIDNHDVQFEETKGAGDVVEILINL
jgi:hypothetical protein